MASELRTGATATRTRKPPRAADDGGAASTTESSHRTEEQTRNQVMYKLTSDTMDGVCASVREAHIQGDNEQGHQKDGVCRERSATDVPSITKSCGYAVSSARSGTDLTELWSA